MFCVNTVSGHGVTDLNRRRSFHFVDITKFKYKLLLLKSTLRADPDMAAGPMGSFRLGTGFVRSLYCIFIVSESMSLF